MAIGDVYEAENCTDLYYVDTGMFGVSEYGSVYVLDADRPAIVDSGIGADRERVLDALTEVGVAPAALEVIALTHVHLDHAGGAGFLVEECPDARVYVHGIGAPHLADPSRLWEGTKRAVGDVVSHYTEPDPVPETRITELDDGDAVDLGDRALSVHHVPGHAPHQVAFHDPANDAAFTGDAAGIYTPSTATVHPSTPPPNFDPEQALADVETLCEIDPATLCYGHFGAVETGDRLDRYAEILSGWVGAVAEKRTQLDDEAVVEHFVDRADAGREAWGAEKGEQEAMMNVRGVLVALDRGD